MKTASTEDRIDDVDNYVLGLCCFRWLEVCCQSAAELVWSLFSMVASLTASLSTLQSLLSWVYLVFYSI